MVNTAEAGRHKNIVIIKAKARRDHNRGCQQRGGREIATVVALTEEAGTEAAGIFTDDAIVLDKASEITTVNAGKLQRRAAVAQRSF